MAEKNMLGHVEEILTCAMCLEILEDPQTLQCLHSYCLKCLKQLTICNENGEGYNCPQCRRFTANADARKVHFVVQLLDAYNVSKTVNEGIICETCKEKPASWKCIDCTCENYHCDSCKWHHDKCMNKFNQNHQVLLIEDFKNADCVITRSINCDKHKDHKLEVFCTVCEQVVCVLCKVLLHDGHKSTSVAEALDFVLVKMEAGLSDLENLATDQQQKIKEFKSQWEQTSKDYDEEVSQLDEGLEDAIDKLRLEHIAKNSVIEEKRKTGKQEIEHAIADEENKIKEETLLIRWIKTTRAKTTGASLLAEFQGNLISKVTSTVQKYQPMVYHSTRCYDWNIDLENKWTQENYFLAQTVTGKFHDYTRLSIIWGKINVVNHINSKFGLYNMDGTLASSFDLPPDIKIPRVCVQISDAEALLAAASGLYLINRSAKILQVIDQGDFSDGCVKMEKNTRQKLVFGLEWTTGKVNSYYMGTQWKLKKTIQLEGYGNFNNVENTNYSSTFVVSDDCIFVCMIYKHTIVKYDHNGVRLDEYHGSQRGIQFPSLCGIDKKSNLLVADFNNERVGILNNKTFEIFVTFTGKRLWYAVFQNPNVLWVLCEGGAIYKFTHNGNVNL